MSATKRDVSRRIRIIKHPVPQAPVTTPGDSSTATTTTRGDAEKLKRRGAAATVTRWISEMRERKDEESKLAFESLFQTAA